VPPADGIAVGRHGYNRDLTAAGLPVLVPSPRGAQSQKSFLTAVD